MVDVNDAEVIAGRGIVGDRYFKRQGTYSVFRTSTKNVGKREPGRQITLVAAEGIEEALLVNAIPRFECLGDFLKVPRPEAGARARPPKRPPYGAPPHAAQSPPPRSGGTRTASIIIVDYAISDRVA